MVFEDSELNVRWVVGFWSEQGDLFRIVVRTALFLETWFRAYRCQATICDDPSLQEVGQGLSSRTQGDPPHPDHRSLSSLKNP